jgi:methylphosphotriester-DNA--protein-cysteine methyltransferase
MTKHIDMTNSLLHHKIRQQEFIYAGNAKLKIYGTLHCASGKRMKKENRVFFATEQEAILLCYRPCGNCMKFAYKKWKDEFI